MALVPDIQLRAASPQPPCDSGDQQARRANGRGAEKMREAIRAAVRVT